MSMSKKSNQAGFTVIELVVVAIILAIAGFLVFFQMNNIKIADEDSQRKAAVNAMYYGLEEVYYEKNQSYPASLTSATLPSIDPSLFTDPDGFVLGKEAVSEAEMKTLVESGEATDDVTQRLAAISTGKQPNYHYDATNCDTAGNCKSYTLRADLVSEAQYVKKSRHNS